LPYYPSEKDYLDEGDMPILFLPVSMTIFEGLASPEGDISYGFGWLEACFLEYYNQGAQLFHFYLHSPSMTDPHYISLMDKFLSFVSTHKNINFKFVSEINIYPKKVFHTNIFPYIAGANRNLFKTLFKKYLFKNE
jgi:hypothetical protein